MSWFINNSLLLAIDIDIAILNANGNTYRCILMGISKNEGLKRLNDSVTYDKRVL